MSLRKFIIPSFSKKFIIWPNRTKNPREEEWKNKLSLISDISIEMKFRSGNLQLYFNYPN